MPEIGEIKRARESEYKGPLIYVWHACETCGKERWVKLTNGIPVSLHCSSCAHKGKFGEKNSGWKGGRRKRKDGYIEICLQPHDFFYEMTDHIGYVREHRLVVARALGRCLQSWEIVHHKHAKYPCGSDEDKQDNRYPENLQLISDLGHKQLTMLERKIDKQTTLIKGLGKEIRLLRWQLSEADKVLRIEK